MRQDDFILEEDYVYECACEDCGYETEVTESTEWDECPKCGCENFLTQTFHDGLECELCGDVISMYEDAYRSDDLLICVDCFQELD